jgi:hypothetical protein
MEQLKVVIVTKVMEVKIAAKILIVSILVSTELASKESVLVTLVGKAQTVLNLCVTLPTVTVMVYVMETNLVIQCASAITHSWERNVFRSIARTIVLCTVIVSIFSVTVIEGMRVNVVSINSVMYVRMIALNMDVVTSRKTLSLG